MNDIKKILKFIYYAEGLKTELRHASKSDRGRESVADHTWRLSLLLMLVAPKLLIEIDLLRAMKMAVVHDIVEIEAKDIPLLKSIGNRKLIATKEKNERVAIKNIRKKLGKNGEEIHHLWQEFEEAKTKEAKVVHALDKLEGQLQFLHDPIRKFTKKEMPAVELTLNETSKQCKIDPFIEKLDLMSLQDRRDRISD
jgi:putative hydrolases of HD superfamily